MLDTDLKRYSADFLIRRRATCDANVCAGRATSLTSI